MWHDGGRDLSPHLFIHNDLFLLIRSFRSTLQSLSDLYLALQARALSFVAGSPGGRRDLLLAASPLDAGMGSLSPLVQALQALSTRMLAATNHAATEWCHATWPELFGSPPHGHHHAKSAGAKAAAKAADLWLVRKHMPKPLPTIPTYIVMASDEAKDENANGHAKVVIVSNEPALSPSPSPPPLSSSSSATAAAVAAAAHADRPSPLLPLVEEYLLPLLKVGASVCQGASVGLVGAQVLQAILQSFLAFLLPAHAASGSSSGGSSAKDKDKAQGKHHAAARIRINAQGAARLNVEAKWLWKWMHFDQVRPAGSPPLAAAAVAVAAASSSGFPHAESLFLHGGGVDGVLSAPMVRWWRWSFVGCPRLASTWARLAAVIQVLLQPQAYARLNHGVSDMGAPTTAATSMHASTNNKRPIGSSSSAPVAAPVLSVWRWSSPSSTSSGVASSSPSPPPSQAQVSKASNRVAPLPFSPASPSSGGDASLSPSPSPSPSPLAGPNNALADSRGLRLPDLDQWLAITSSAHAKEFVQVGNGNVTVVDWPTSAERR